MVDQVKENLVHNEEMMIMMCNKTIKIDFLHLFFLFLNTVNSRQRKRIFLEVKNLTVNIKTHPTCLEATIKDT